VESDGDFDSSLRRVKEKVIKAREDRVVKLANVGGLQVGCRRVAARTNSTATFCRQQKYSKNLHACVRHDVE